MGRHYAAKQGLPAAVSEAVFEACLPRQVGLQGVPRVARVGITTSQ